jgi:hypothetical protein
MGVLWREAGDEAKAAAYFEKALAMECSGPERRYLEKQRRMGLEDAGY